MCSEGTGEETGGEIWDPLDISGAVGDEALMWFRASELKHGRVAMLASVGYIAGAAGITFPGNIAGDTSFASVNADGVFSAWSNVPEGGKLQVSLAPARDPRVTPLARVTPSVISRWRRRRQRRRGRCRTRTAATLLC